MKTKEKLIPLVLSHPWVIIIAVVILMAIIVILGNQSFRATEKATMDEFNHRQLVMAREAANGIEMYFNFIGGVSKSLAKEVGEVHLDEMATRKIIGYEMIEMESLGVDDIAILDADGVVRYNVNAPQIEGKNFSWRKYFQKAKDLNPAFNGFLTEFIEFKGVEAGKQGMLIAAPIFVNAGKNDGISLKKFGGVAVSTIKLNNLTEKFIANIKSSARGHAFLMDNDYNILWSPDETLFGKNILEASEEFPVFQQILGKMSVGETSTTEYSYYYFDYNVHKFATSKEKNLIAYVPVNVGQELWSIGVWAPMKDAKKLIHSAYTKQMILVGLIIIITFIGSAYIIILSFRYNKTLETEVDIKTRDFKESHQRLITVLDSLDAGVYVSDMETYEILFLNNYLKEIYGDVAGKICWQVFQPDQFGPCDFCKKEKLLTADGEPGEIVVWEYQNSITGKWYDVHDRAIRWVDGRIVKLEIAADITARKIASLELERAHNDMGTFCNILKQIGTQNTLDGVGSFLMNELKDILNTPYMLLYVFNSDRSSLFILSEKGTTFIKDHVMMQNVKTTIEDLDGVTMGPEKAFEPPLLPDHFPANERQTIIPFRVQNYDNGAFVVACTPNCLCDKNKLDMVSLILEKASGTINRAILHHEE